MDKKKAKELAKKAVEYYFEHFMRKSVKKRQFSASYIGFAACFRKDKYCLAHPATHAD